MRFGLISFFILTGCGRPDPGLDIVRLPQTAYGPFDAAASKGVAGDAGSDAAPKSGPTSQVECFVPDEPLGDDEETADAPFDNCPKAHAGGRFNDKATSQRRAHNRDACCYSVVRRQPKSITIPEVD